MKSKTVGFSRPSPGGEEGMDALVNGRFPEPEAEAVPGNTTSVPRAHGAWVGHYVEWHEPGVRIHMAQVKAAPTQGQYAGRFHILLLTDRRYVWVWPVQVVEVRNTQIENALSLEPGSVNYRSKATPEETERERLWNDMENMDGYD